MTVKEMIDKLSEFPPDLEVFICDGDRCEFYEGDFVFHKSSDGPLDIWVSGCDIWKRGKNDN